MGISLKVYVSPKAAIMAGKTLIREQVVDLDDGFVASLTPEQRAELVQLVTDNTEQLGHAFKLSGSYVRDFELSEPTLEQVKLGLEHRAKVRHEKAEQHRLEQERIQNEMRAAAEKLLNRPAEEFIEHTDIGVTMTQELYAHRHNPLLAELVAEVDAEIKRQHAANEARKREEAEVARRAEEKKAVQRKQAIHKWVKEHGTDSQKDRLKEGVLPDDEVLKDIRDDLFGDLAEFDRYARLKAEDVCACDCVDNVDFVTDNIVELSADQYDQFSVIRSNAPDSAKVEAKRHHGSCPNCTCDQVTRYSALVTVEWNGYTLSREYAL